MAISAEIKNQVLDDYLNNDLSIKQLSEKYSLKYKTVAKWIQRSELKQKKLEQIEKTIFERYRERIETNLNEMMNSNQLVSKMGVEFLNEVYEQKKHLSDAKEVDINFILKWSKILLMMSQCQKNVAEIMLKPNLFEKQKTFQEMILASLEYNQQTKTSFDVSTYEDFQEKEEKQKIFEEKDDFEDETD